MKFFVSTKCNHNNCSFAYRMLLNSEKHSINGKPEVGHNNFYVCFDCGATLRTQGNGTSHPFGVPHESWVLPNRLKG